MGIEFAESEREAGEAFARLSGTVDEFESYAHPLGARILRVADAYAALTDARPFRPAGTEIEARKHLILWAGLEFDPHVVRAFLALEGLPELRSFARERRTEEQTAVEEQTVVDEEPAVEDSAETPGEEVVHVGEQTVENPMMSVE